MYISIVFGYCVWICAMLSFLSAGCCAVCWQRLLGGRHNDPPGWCGPAALMGRTEKYDHSSKHIACHTYSQGSRRTTMASKFYNTPYNNIFYPVQLQLFSYNVDIGPLSKNQYSFHLHYGYFMVYKICQERYRDFIFILAE